MSLRFCWTGTNSLAFYSGDCVLWVDPFFTRPPAYSMFRHVCSDRALVSRCVDRADAVLVTHAHYDHLLDVPEVLRITGARAYGSPVTAALLQRQGISEERAAVVQIGDALDLGFCRVEVLPAWHTHTPLDRWINGPTSETEIARLRLPLRLIDYRMDICYSFRIHFDGGCVLVGNSPAAADTVFVSPYVPDTILTALLHAASPRLVVAVHWDDFTRPLSQPFQPMLVTRSHGLSGWQPVGRINPILLSRRVQAVLPGTRVIVPSPFQMETLS